MFMEGALGAKVKTDKLKLSDFIDESFFDDVDMGDEVQNGKKGGSIQMNYLKDMVQSLKEKSADVFMQLSTKRQKTSNSNTIKQKWIILSPVLALIIQIIISESLIEGDWKVRQTAINTVRVALQKIKPQYYIVGDVEGGKLQVIEERQIAIQELVKALLPQVFIVIMKDHFNDFEELKVITPVREEACLLLIDIIKINGAEEMI